jgi:hypothetical protein
MSMPYEGFASQFSNPQPFGNKIYVAADIVRYCKSANIDVASYVSSIEAGIDPRKSLFIEYNPKNGDHVNDVINEGSVLVSNGLRNNHISIPPVASMMKEEVERRTTGTVINLKEAFPDDHKKNQIAMLKSFGIDYSQSPLSDSDSQYKQDFYIDRPIQESRKPNTLFNKLVEELNK